MKPPAGSIAGAGRRDRDDLLTLAALGPPIAIGAAIAHEVLGHALGCLAEGGHVTLLTFLIFRCAGAGVLADGAGPIAALASAALAFAALARARSAAPVIRVLLMSFATITVLWVCAQMVRDAIVAGDDWGHVARDLGWPIGWRPVVAGLGAAGYVVALRIAGRLVPAVAAGRPMRLLVPYGSAALSASLLGALWQGDRAAPALDAMLSFGAAPLGYLVVIAAAARRDPVPGQVVSRDLVMAAGSLALFIAFAATIARGIGQLA